MDALPASLQPAFPLKVSAAVGQSAPTLIAWWEIAEGLCWLLACLAADWASQIGVGSVPAWRLQERRLQRGCKKLTRTSLPMLQNTPA